MATTTPYGSIANSQCRFAPLEIRPSSRSLGKISSRILANSGNGGSKYFKSIPIKKISNSPEKVSRTQFAQRIYPLNWGMHESPEMPQGIWDK